MMRRGAPGNKRRRGRSMDPTSVCVANVTSAGRRRRLVLGAASLGAAALALGLGLPRPWSLALAAPLAYGSLCVAQALAGT